MRVYTALLTYTSFSFVAVAISAEHVIRSIYDLKYDENGKLAKHTGELVTTRQSVTFFEFQ